MAMKAAYFARADLHIHSYGEEGSYDVADPEMTPEAIVDRAVSAGLEVLSITDHNEIGNVRRAQKAAEGKPVFVVPGVELSTPAGHLLVYAPTLEALRRIIGLLTFDSDRRACRTSAVDVLRHVEANSGLAIMAHIDLDSGLEAMVPNYGDQKRSLISSRTLVAVEISSLDALDWYSLADPVEGRREILEERLRTLGSPFASDLAKVRNSDAHSLSALGRNADNETRLTRLKISARNWESVRAAFSDPEARVRMEDTIPERIPRIESLTLSGGFLDNTDFQFATNLTSIIGGRGSGKSTAFQALRAALGHRPNPHDLQASDAWPNHIRASYRDSNDQIHEIECDGQSLVRTINGLADAPVIRVDCLSQGEMASTIERYGDDPGALLGFLDSLIDLRELKERRAKLREELVENGNLIEELLGKTASLRDVDSSLKFKEGLLKQARESGSEALVSAQTELARSIQIRQSLEPLYNSTKLELLKQLDDSPLDRLEDVAGTVEKVEESGVENPVPRIVSDVRAALTKGRADVEKAFETGAERLRTFVAACRVRQLQLQRKIETEVEALRKKGIPVNIKDLTSLSNRVEELRAQKTRLIRYKTELKREQNARRDLLKDFRDTHDKIGFKRSQLAEKLKTKLQAFLIDWRIGVKILPARLAPDVEKALCSAANWQTTSVRKAQALVRYLGADDISRAATNLDREHKIASALDGDGQAILRTDEAERFVQHMNEFSRRRVIEEAVWEDLPVITVSRQGGSGSGDSVVTRQFSQLSLGQQQSIIVAIMLSIESTDPLLIDQPEDNLDSAFVFQILVRALRQIKERRQVILVTHNANIAVLGDSDLVVPLKAKVDRGMILEAGTVDQPETRDLACEILEGGKKAYELRGQIYGYAIQR